jgi:hypothetical protein
MKHLPCASRWRPVHTLSTALVLLTACASTAPTDKGVATGTAPDTLEFAQSDVNRMATLSMQGNLTSLLLLADKLYRRNPGELYKNSLKTAAPNRESALLRLRTAIDSRTAWPDLQGKRDIQALALALGPDFAGDRVAAFIYATADMLITAHEGKTTLYLTDSLDAQHIYNAARNIEIAVWMLANRRNAAGQPLLLADEITSNVRNLSFEREFGKVIGRLDLLAMMLTEKYRRAVITYVQSIIGSQFLQFLPVR